VNPIQIAAEFGIPVEDVRARWMMLRVARWKADFKLFAREVVKIRAKDGELVPLILNEAQEMLLEAGENHLRDEQWIRLLGLKGRRQGFSTMVAARGYWRATLWDRQKVYIQSHEMTSSGVLFDMVDLMQQKHPFPPAVGRDNAKELEFVQRGSAYTVATAGQKAGGRGGGGPMPPTISRLPCRPWTRSGAGGACCGIARHVRSPSKRKCLPGSRAGPVRLPKSGWRRRPLARPAFSMRNTWTP